jgi:hypothetical protein
MALNGRTTEKLKAEVLTQNFQPVIHRKELRLFEEAFSLRLLPKRS